MDRAHRIGQTKQVKVYRFVTEVRQKFWGKSYILLISLEESHMLISLYLLLPY